MTHTDCVNAAYRWLVGRKSYHGCGVAFKELVALNNTGEIPDVIGFGAWGHSVLIECKVTRSDFHKDRKKPFRVNPDEGMGTYRYYACPTGMIKPDELPPKWGLIYINSLGHTKVIVSVYKSNYCGIDRHDNAFTVKNNLAEAGAMYSALRRLHIDGMVDSLIHSKVISNGTEGDL